MADRSWMIFVDGENLTLRGQDVADAYGLELSPGPLWKRDVFVWIPYQEATRPLIEGGPVFAGTSKHAIRAHYYTSTVGDDIALQETREALRALGFHPEVFKKPRGSRSKRVDITLARDLLSHAFLGNFDVALLVAGDADYIPLVDEVKRRGKNVAVAFFASYGLNPALRLSADGFRDITNDFASMWRSHLESLAGEQRQ
jgi:hypothetical protein